MKGEFSNHPLARHSFCLAIVLAASCNPWRHGNPAKPPSPAQSAWDLAHEAEEDGRAEDALAGYAALCDGRPPFPRACYDFSKALFRLGRIAEARESSVRFVVAHPDHALAPSAVVRLSSSFLEGNEADSGLVTLEALAGRVRGTEAWDSVVYAIADLHAARGDAASQSKALERIAAMGRWGSQLWDDSIWRLQELAAARGDVAARRAWLEKLAGSRESSALIGSYNSKHHDDALLALGQMAVDAGDLAGAYERFAELAAWKSSRLRDDGALGAASVRLKQGRIKDGCLLLSRFVEQFPESKFLKEAEELILENGCGAAAAR